MTRHEAIGHVLRWVCLIVLLVFVWRANGWAVSAAVTWLVLSAESASIRLARHEAEFEGMAALGKELSQTLRRK